METAVKCNCGLLYQCENCIPKCECGSKTYAFYDKCEKHHLEWINKEPDVNLDFLIHMVSRCIDCANNEKSNVMCDEHVKYFKSYCSFDRSYYESKKCLYCVYPANSTSKMCDQHNEDIMKGMCVSCSYNEVKHTENNHWCDECNTERCSCGDDADYNGSCISCLKLDHQQNY